LVGLNKDTAEAGKDIAMQIAALNPVAVDAASVPADVIAREKSIIVELMKQDPKMAGKPDEMLTKLPMVKWEHSLKNKL
jgi:elongation factor Ts